MKMLKISAFYLDKQKSFVPIATKLCNSCNMMLDVSKFEVSPSSIVRSYNWATEKSDVLGLRMTPNQPATPPFPGKNLSVAWITLLEDSNCTIESIRMIDGVF